MPRFVILTHDHPLLHWDFMLEKEAGLRTWRLARAPASGGMIEAERLVDHRLAYLDYEGPVSGNRGSVRAFDRGEYEPLEDSDERVAVSLQGGILKGKVSFCRVRQGGGWTFEYVADEEPDISDRS